MHTDHEFASLGFLTKQNIFAALTELSETIPFNRITVKQLCETAGVSRSTFYHHFKDRNSVMQWHSSILYTMGVDRIGRTRTWAEGHLITTVLMQKHRNLYLKAGMLNEYGSARNFFVRHHIEVLTDTVTTCFNVEISPLLAFQIQATAEMEAAMANRMYTGELGLKPEEYAAYIERSVPHELYEITKEPIEKEDLDLAVLLAQI